ncbi:MAG TPA: cadherin domain-containing protein [Allosphingosinicella sp.]|jgi:hypothetical protein|nr:cadherin domain-containing protein [Allosphingosinicella sp.]
MAYGRRGGEFVVNKQLTGIQYAPSIAGFASGGFIVVWNTLDTLQDGSGRAIKAQRYDSLGNAVGPEVLINSSAAGDQRAPSVTTLASGGYVVTWETTDTTQDGSGLAIKGQLFDSSGAAVGAEFRVNSQTASDQTKASVTGLEGGGFVVTWQTADSTQDGHTSAIKGQIYNSAGAAVGGEFLVNTGAVGAESLPSVTSLAGGGFVATWTLGSGQQADIYAQVFDPSGAKSGGQFRVNTTTSLNQDYSSVTQISGGRFVVTWMSAVSLTTNDTEIRARIFSANGTPIGNDFAVSTTRIDPDFGTPAGPTQPNVEDLPNGGFVITWTNSAGNYIWTSIRGQYFDSNGNRVGSEVLVSTATDRAEGQSDVAVDGNGMLFAVWGSANQSLQNDDIRGQLFGAAGAPEIVSNGGGDTASVTAAENQNAVTTVTAVDPDASGTLVYSIVGGLDASRFAINATTGALTFVSAPNFEARLDFNNNNMYDVVVSVSDGVNTDVQALLVTVTNVNEAPTISGSQTAYFHRENGTAVDTFTATDPDGTALTWSIAGGADAARFAIDPVTGALRFVAAPNFEAPTDAGADNFYNVTIAASDGSLTATRALTIEIANLNEGPVIVSGGGGDTAAYSVQENNSTITTIVADDPDLQDSAYTFSIVGGADAALFTILQNGLLVFKSSGRNFEAPTDADGNNVYEVIVSVSDGFNPADTQAISVTVTDANDAPVITSGGGSSSASYSIVENQLAVTTVTGTDADNQPLTYGIAGGADAARFTINAQTGLLSFVSAPDREAPADVGANNVYNVTVSVSDGQKSAVQLLSITVLNANEAPIISSNGGGATAAVTVAENQNGVTTFTAVDPEGASGLVYAIAGGADSARFAINASTGVLTFVSPPDFESRQDAGGDNVYDVVVSVSDGSLTDTQALAVTVSNVNEGVTLAPSETHYLLAENSVSVAAFSATDLDGDALSWSIAGGADAARFAIDPATGALRFVAAPDFEAPGDAGADNNYDVVISASDGTLSASRALTVAVTDRNEGPVIVSGGGGASAAIGIQENLGYVTTVVADDPDSVDSSYSFSIVGGADAALFSINAQTGQLYLAVSGRDFEAPADADGDHVYEVIVAVGDGLEAPDIQAISVTVTDANEAPIVTSHGGSSSVALTFEEGVTTVATVVAFDPDGTTPVYSITGGSDAALFTVDSATGVVRFVEAPDYETRRDALDSNIYEVIVSAGDGALSSSQFLSVLITNVNEPVTITSAGGADSVAVTVAEDQAAVADVDAVDTDGTPVFYSIAGGADSAFFGIDPLTGELTIVGADFDLPADADGDNVYEVIVSADDGWLSDTQAYSVTVADVDEPLNFTSYNSDFYVSLEADENGLDAAVVAAEDPEGRPIVYSIVDTYDGASFTIDAQTGVVRFATAPDHEAPGDLDGDNVYTILVAASDGTFFDYQTLSIQVRDLEERPAITTGAALAVNEDSAFVARVAASDSDGDPISYAIVGGADASHFSIDAQTGDLSIRASLDYEAPADADGDNVYEIVVRASDGQLADERHFSITVNDVYDDVDIVSYGGADLVSLTVEESGGFQVADVDASFSAFQGARFAIAGGADAALFKIDPYDGKLSFNYPFVPDFEAPGDADGDNVYDVVVVATMGTSSDTQAFAITVANRNEGLWITSDGGGDASLTLDEGTGRVTTVAAYDLDGDVPAYSIVGGADAALFAIDSATGVLTFIAAPDYEAPASSAGTNVYLVEVGASDGQFTGTQRIRIEIGNVNERPVIASGGGGDTAAVTVNENGLAVTTVAAGDADGNPLTYSIVGGADASRFTIESWSGVLRFVQAPNFEAPGDSGGDNVYDVVVSVTDGALTDSQALSVTVANLTESVAITSNGGGASASIGIFENASAVAAVAASNPDGGTLVYAIAGGADAARFTINASTGLLAFVSAPNFEAPADAGANNIYDVVVSVSNGSTTDTQALAVAVGNLDEAVAIVSNGGGASAAVSVNENVAAVTTVVGSDPDGGAVTYVILNGGDSALFTIDSTTGALAFRSAPNFEAPGDSDGDNVYNLVVMASDGLWSDTQAIAVTVRNVGEAPVIASNGGGGSASVSVAENGVAVATVSASNPDGGTLTYAIAGGADAARFTINAATGVLAFVAAPNFEAPADAGANNVYDVVVSASNGAGTDTQAIAVTVGNVNEVPVITSGGGGAGSAVAVAENGLAVMVVAATDPDGTAPTYSIVGGADAARFTINPQTGLLQFVAAPDYELPADSNQDNVYSVVVRASDGAFWDDQALTVTVGNVRDGNDVIGTSAGDSISATSTNAALRTSNEEDTVYGRDGHDTIQGMAGDDDLYGEAGNDVLIGGAGADKLTGGLGKDTFTYDQVSDSTASSRDQILDFSRVQGDKISLSGIDANVNLTSNQAFTFIGTAAFSNVAGQLRYETSGGVTTISGDVNGDGIADLQILVSGSVAMLSSDFVL